MYRKSLFFSLFLLTHTLDITILTVSVMTVMAVNEAIVLNHTLRETELVTITQLVAPERSTEDHKCYGAFTANCTFPSQLCDDVIWTFYYYFFLALLMQTDTTPAFL